MTPRYILSRGLDGEAEAVGGVLEKSELGACLNLESAEVEGTELADLPPSHPSRNSIRSPEIAEGDAWTTSSRSLPRSEVGDGECQARSADDILTSSATRCRRLGGQSSTTSILNWIAPLL